MGEVGSTCGSCHGDNMLSAWYRYSWKGDAGKSGGIATNIGIHFFDLLMWLFGSAEQSQVHLRQDERSAGAIILERADVSWFLSIDRNDLPFEPEPGKPATYRSITVDGEEIEFTGGFTDLHTRVYEETLAGRGFGIEDARPSVELVQQLRQEDPEGAPNGLHPFAAEALKR